MQNGQCTNCKGEGLYICMQCSQIFCRLCIPEHEWSHSRLYNLAPKVSKNSNLLKMNLVCALCYNGDSTFIFFIRNMIRRVCDDCKEILISQGKQIFDPEWESLIRKDKNIIRASERCQKLKELANVFQEKEKNFIEERSELKNNFESGLLKKNKILYDVQKKSIMQKKEESRKFFNIILSEAREHLGNTKPNENTLVEILLKALARGEEIRELNDINMIATLKENREEFLENLRNFRLFKYTPVREFII